MTENHLTEIIVSLDSHITDNVTKLRIELSLSLFIVVIAINAHALWFALGFGLMGIGIGIDNLRYLNTLARGKSAMIGLQTDIETWESEQDADFWA